MGWVGRCATAAAVAAVAAAVDRAPEETRGPLGVLLRRTPERPLPFVHRQHRHPAAEFMQPYVLMKENSGWRIRCPPATAVATVGWIWL